jgi:hypothetical protein
MEMTQAVSNPTEMPHDVIKVGAVDGPLMLATIWIELKPERVQESLAAGGGGEAASLSLQLSIHQSQTVTFSLSGAGLAITFNNGSFNGSAAPAA